MGQRATTYRAVQAVAPGKLELVQKPLTEPPSGHVRIRVEAWDGCYAESMIAKTSGLMSVPDDLSSVEAAPLLCAGLTTFSALRNSPARAGDLVAILGVGGLGHLGVQYARRMGFEVVGIDRGAGDRAELAKKLGAHHYVDSTVSDVAKALQALGGATVVLATASGGKAVGAAVK